MEKHTKRHKISICLPEQRNYLPFNSYLELTEFKKIENVDYSKEGVH